MHGRIPGDHELHMELRVMCMGCNFQGTTTRIAYIMDRHADKIATLSIIIGRDSLRSPNTE